MITPYHEESGRLRYYHVEYGRPNQLPPANAAWSIDSSQAYTAYEWHLLYPDDAALRDAAIMSLLRLAHSTAAKFGRRIGADMFSVGLATITNRINGDKWRGVPVPNWSTLLRWRMLDYLDGENGRVAKAIDADVNEGWFNRLVREAREYRRVPCEMDVFQQLVAGENAAERDGIVAACLADPDTRYIFEARAAGQTMEEIADSLGVTTVKIQRTIKRVQKRACAMMGIRPPKREPRAHGRGKVKRRGAA